MKLLIVNADDFGMTPGINDGIVRTHLEGIVTSTSLMVDQAGSADAARRLGQLPQLGVGLHVTLTAESGEAAIDFDDEAAARGELERQVELFRGLTGRDPSHLDAHHNVHRDARLAPLFQQMADALDVPLRERSAVRYFPDFYGVWDDGRTHPEWIAYGGLARMLAENIGPGITELSCHPGHPEPGFESGYGSARAIEVETLCDPRLPGLLEELGIRLVAYPDLASAPTGWKSAE